jgi:hypothetical protein
MNMMKNSMRHARRAMGAAALLWMNSSYALDSYRFLHVTIETPWTIFIFLLFAVFAPFILMAILSWRYVERKKEAERAEEGKEQ